jgi:para-nitrobenzyl esterase
MRRLTVRIAAGLLFAAGVAVAQAAPVRVDGGVVDGTAQAGVRVYKGIPFAAAPLGRLRWRPPAAVVPWEGVKKTVAFAPICEQTQIPLPQFGIPILPMSEDCLYLNVWTPAKSAKAKLPVMVWIYGGGFTGGGTALPVYDGADLVKRGVVLVSIAYRVGPFGFLAHPELDAESPAHASGTYGLMDQIAGLQWVKRNIAAFGGDSNNVTIFGESAGGISVSMLAASPKAKGLFQRAISESGGSFAPAKDEVLIGGENVPTMKMAEQQGTAFVAQIGAKSIAEARNVPADAIVKAAGPQLGKFWPALDGDVIADDQYKLYESGRYNDVPVLIGWNSDEGAPFVPRDTVAEYTSVTHQAYGEKADQILAAYPAKDDAQALRSARDLFRDAAFGWPTWTWARLQSRTGKAKVFVYYFTHRPPYPDLPFMKDWGAGHGAEIAYVFGNAVTGHPTAEDRALSNLIQTCWVNFAKTGDPNGGSAPRWPAFSESAPQMMQLDVKPTSIPVPNVAQMQTLDAYFARRRSEEH